MAKKKKARRPASSISASESANVRQAVEELRDYYQLGLDVLEADRKNPKKRTYSKGVSLEFAERLGKGRDYVDKARQFASKYTKEQLEELCALRRPDGAPLGRRHVIALLSISDKRQRRSIQRRAAKEGWGTRRLGEEITAIQERVSLGGRRPRGPESIIGALTQIVKMCERWTRWYEGFEASGAQSAEGHVSLDDLPKSVKKSLKAASDQIEELREKAKRAKKAKSRTKSP